MLGAILQINMKPTMYRVKYLHTQYDMSHIHAHNLDLLIKICVLGFLKKEMESPKTTIPDEYLIDKMECLEMTPFPPFLVV